MASAQRWRAEGADGTGDNREARTYAAVMARGQPFIRLKLDIDQAIELSEFVGAFTAIASEYDRFIRHEQPGTSPDATLFVKEVRAGCIEADLIAWGVGLSGLGVSAVAIAAGYNTLDEFVERLGSRLRIYLKPGGRVLDASKSELSDFTDQVAAIASTPGSALEVAVIQIENGEQKISAAFRFNTDEAREIQHRIVEHKQELDHKSRADFERILMVFTRSDVRPATLGKRSGEQVVIDRVSPKPRPLIYASSIAEERIRHEIAEEEDNVFKKGFVVDVNVEYRVGKPIAYSVTALHEIIDLPDDDDD